MGQLYHKVDPPYGIPPQAEDSIRVNNLVAQWNSRKFLIILSECFIHMFCEALVTKNYTLAVLKICEPDLSNIIRV